MSNNKQKGYHMRKPVPFVVIAILLGLLISGFGQRLAAAQPHALAPLLDTPNSPAAFTNYRAVTDDNSACNLTHSNCSQQQPSTAVNPANPLNVVIAGKDWRPADGNQRYVWLYTTTDSGASWANQPITYPAGTTVFNSTDGVVQWDGSGNVYANVIAYNTAPSIKEGNYVTHSSDGGRTWSTAVQVDAVGHEDRAWLAIDKQPSSPYFGRLYVCWYDYVAHNDYCAHSADQGASWSAPGLGIPTPRGYINPVVQPDGTLNVFYNNEDTLNLVRSTDGGNTFAAPIIAATITGVYNNRSGRGWNVNSIPAAAVGPEGNLYLTWLDDRNEATSGWDIYFTHSTDNGASWAAPLKVNDDSGNHDQFEPAIAVAPNGRIDVVFMDMRNDPANILADLYYTSSADDGQSFATNQRVTDVNFNLSDGIPSDSYGDAGDYLGVSATNSDVWAAWTDTRNSDGHGSHAEDVYAGHLHISTPTVTPVPATNTPAPSNTPGGPTNTPIPTNTPAPPTNTPAPSNTPGGPTSTALPPTATPADCSNPFIDLQGNIFYAAIHTLNCRGVVNGTDATHYSPAASSTRGQFARVIVLAVAVPFFTPTNGPTFSDVSPTYFAYLYIESGYQAAILSGFDQAGCQAAGATYPCYLPNRAITRAQLTKLVVNATHYPLVTPGTQTFSDVPSSNVFYIAVETAHAHHVINGFPDHNFRPNQSIRRDEMAQIVYAAAINPLFGKSVKKGYV